MALAPFFPKAAWAASLVLQGFDHSAFEQRLLTSPIGLAFDAAAVDSSEGRVTLDMAVRLLARLYPTVVLQPLDAHAQAMSLELAVLLKSINPLISLTNDVPVATLVVGNTSVPGPQPVFYVGSTGWTAKFSSVAPVCSSTSGLPFGAGAAACFGASNIFRAVFAAELPSAPCDTAFELSLFDYDVPGSLPPPVDLRGVALAEMALVGIGAVGNGAVWALGHLRGVSGTVHLVDEQTIELSNLQRYVLPQQLDADGQSVKVEIAEKVLLQTDLTPIPHPCDWGTFVQQQGHEHLPLVAVALDSAEDRIAVQAALPPRVLNAWTQPENLGVSRHFNFLRKPCLACLYLPTQQVLSESQLVAQALGLPHREMEIQNLLYYHTPLNRQWLLNIATAKGRTLDELLPFEGKPVQTFYREALCGGLLLNIGAKDQRTETPMAFQSALAGIMLAAEMVITAGNLRTQILPTKTTLNLLKPFSPYLSFGERKHPSNTCLCQDDAYRQVYATRFKSTIL
jgi:hypothetical protein